MFTKQICGLLGAVGLVAASVAVGPEVKDAVKSAINQTPTAAAVSDDVEADGDAELRGDAEAGEALNHEVIGSGGVYVGSHSGPVAVAIAGPVGAVSASGLGVMAGSGVGAGAYAGVGAGAYAGVGGISIASGTGMVSTANSHGGRFSGMVSRMDSSGKVTTYTYGGPGPQVFKTRNLEPVTVAPKTAAPRSVAPAAKGTAVIGGTSVTRQINSISRPADYGSLGYTDQMVSDGQGGYWREYGYTYTSQGKPYSELRRVHVRGW